MQIKTTMRYYFIPSNMAINRTKKERKRRRKEDRKGEGKKEGHLGSRERGKKRR